MRILKKIIFPVFLFALISFFLAHDIVNHCHHERSKIENTAGGSGSRDFCTSETSAEEDVSFFIQYYTAQWIKAGGRNLSTPVSTLPPKLYYSIWLPPDNS